MLYTIFSNGYAMSKTSLTVNIMNLKCALCKNCLNTPPVYTQSTGDSICKKCNTASNKPSFRNYVYERMLKRALFPCKYAHRGCTARLLADNMEHNRVCIYQNYKCPVGHVSFSLGDEQCKWEGKPNDLFAHFKDDTEHHYIDEIVKQQFQFQKCSKILKLAQVKKRNFLILIDAVTANICIEVFNLYEGDAVRYRVALYQPKVRQQAELRKEGCTRVLGDDEERIVKYDKFIIAKTLGVLSVLECSIHFYIQNDR